MENDEIYMARALQLARNGELYASPNPMVGAVIVDSQGNIIGEGYHRRCGEAHAEVNAIAAVKDPDLLRDSTIYVTLEPCAHYGRTGPCSKLIIDKKIPRVVVGARDPFSKVDGKGIEMMRQAGIEVKVGVLEQECKKLNAIFFTAHLKQRPFICLKWAQSADGFLNKLTADKKPVKLSTTLTQTLMHRLRARFDAIMIGSGTALADNPSLENRLWAGHSPLPVVLDRRGRCHDDMQIMRREHISFHDDISLEEMLGKLYQKGITSVLVEGGSKLLHSFVKKGLWDASRVEISPVRFGKEGIAPAPGLPAALLVKSEKISENIINWFSQNPLFDVKNL